MSYDGIITPEIDELAQIIWNYMLMHHELKRMDAIFVLGSNDIRVAERAAELYLDGYANYVICSGGNGKDSRLPKPEAEIFGEIIAQKGVPKERIIKEPNAQNTGENITFTKNLLQKMNLDLKSFILVQKPYMERRTYATLRKQWPEADCLVTSPRLTYEEYTVVTDDQEFKYRCIETMVGDLIRIKEYPNLGFQIEQEIPDEVWQAGQELVIMGFDRYAAVLK